MNVLCNVLKRSHRCSLTVHRFQARRYPNCFKKTKGGMSCHFLRVIYLSVDHCEKVRTKICFEKTLKIQYLHYQYDNEYVLVTRHDVYLVLAWPSRVFFNPIILNPEIKMTHPRSCRMGLVRIFFSFRESARALLLL